MNGTPHGDALTLLVATRRLYQEQHPDTPLRPGTPVEPQDACESIEWGRASARCEAALEYLEAERALEPNPILETVARRMGYRSYVWGSGAADMLGES